MDTVTIKSADQPQAITPNTKETKGLLNAKWLWRELGEAKSKEEIYLVLEKVTTELAGNPINVQVILAPEAYTRMMYAAWLAKSYGEITEMTMRSYLDRAMQLMELNLKNIAVKRRS
jgi:hypothetical protein